MPGLLLTLAGPAAAFEPPYESLNAAALLSDRFSSGPDYRIEPEVVNRGLMNHYRIETDYGPMQARSDRNLQQRLQEIRALRELSTIDEGLLVARSAGSAFRETARSVARAIKDPMGTAEGVQRGIQRLLRRGGRKLQSGYRDVTTAVRENENAGNDDSISLPDKALKAGRRFFRNRLGVNRAYRELARKVGVDPYTDNEILRNELDRLAKHAAGASLSTKLVIPRIPGLVGAVENISQLVWKKDRLDLLLHNEDTLAALPVPDPVVREFIDNESYSPTQQTAIVAAVAAMKDVANHWRLIEYAGYADEAPEADFYTNLISLLAVYHRDRARLDTIHPTATVVPVAVTVDGRTVVMFPVDRLRWTRDVAGLVAALGASDTGREEHRELWTTGRVSDRASGELSRYGWILFTQAHQRLASLHTGARAAATASN